MLVCCQKKCLVLHFCQQFTYLFGLVTAYLSPKDNIIYSKVDRQIKWCSNQVLTVCTPEVRESVNCTIKQLEATYGQPQIEFHRFGRTFDTQALEAGLYSISCVDVIDVEEQMKLILHDFDFYLDCASAPRALTRFERKHAVTFCVRHIPLRASWIRHLPRIRILGFLQVECNDTSGLLPFLNGTLLSTHTWDLISVTFTVLCEGGMFNSTVHFAEPVVSRISQEIINSTAVNGQMGLDLFFSGPRTLSYLLDTLIPSAECYWNGLQDIQNMTELNWTQLNGEIGYEVSKQDSGSTLLTVHNFSEGVSSNTFRCSSWAEERCFSKLWIFSQVHPSPEIEFFPLDRVQAFDDILYCNVTHSLEEHTRARMRVLWGKGTFVTTDDNRALWPKLRPVTQRVLLECEAELQYMNVTYSRMSERFLAHITSYANISFEPERSVFWATDTLRCIVNNDDPWIRPYIILARYPTEFHPQLFYETIDFTEFIPGDYLIKCYYFGPNTEKRVLTKNIYVALPPTSIEAEQYVNFMGQPAMRCIDNGYPQSHVSVEWTGPDLTACCYVVDGQLVLSQLATHGVYRVKCDAVVTHPLITLQLSTDASFVVLGMNFRPLELTKSMDRTINKIIIILFSAIGYGLLVLSISAIWFLIIEVNKIRSKKRREQKLPPGEYVRVPQNILSKEEQVILIELLSRFDMVAQLVASLVRESRSNKRIFIIRGFDWRERRGPRFPDFKDRERVPDSTYSWKTALFSFRPTCLKELHRIHNHKWSGSVGTTSVERFTIDEQFDEYATDRAPQRRKRRKRSSFLRRSTKTKTQPFKRRRHILRSRKVTKKTVR
ncbi:hypothetical protein CSKR_104818 [Clonorchis sinensis]|uniref:Uncharacterized protein n=1 Tax=Clonorchis sinensis TaxID=79923 RepID=A0A8T1M9H1_CLOSI|nr:hypothetical protein CSKR_104818 [Clonorchis sinensis]